LGGRVRSHMAEELGETRPQNVRRLGSRTEKFFPAS